MRRILVYAPCAAYMKEPSFRLRLAALVEPLARRGIALEIRVRPKSPLGRVQLARMARDYDGVILHRKMLDPYETRILRGVLDEGAARKGDGGGNGNGPGRIYMDIDDATMYHERPLGMLARRRLERRFLATAGIIDVVCAGNDYLGGIFSEMGVKAVRVMPTVVDPGAYAIKQHGPTDMPRLVWVGSASTLKYLEMVTPWLAEAARRRKGLGLGLVVIGDQPLSEERMREAAGAGLAVEFIPWTLAGEAAALLRGDIGIAPMPEDRWTLGKCGFKIVQYMAAGLPVVASPVGANMGLVKGCGMLAGSAAEWGDAVARLAGDAALRKQLGAEGRRRVEEELCVEKVVAQWAEVLG